MADRPIARIASDFLAVVCLFRDAPESVRPAMATLRNQLLSLLDTIRKEAQAQQLSDAETDAIRFALVAWADETLQSSAWSGVEDWRREPLQLLLFNTVRAGNEFYERLARLGSGDLAAREVFFLCMALGFQGEYVSDPSQRRALLEQNYQILRVQQRAIDPLEQEPLAPPAYAWEYTPQRVSGRQIWPVLTVLALSGLAFWGVLWGILHYMASAVPGAGGSIQ